jgi:hypothetical protein
MRGRIILPFIFIFCITQTIPGFSQGIYSDIPAQKGLIDTLKARGVLLDPGRKKPEIKLSQEQAIDFLNGSCRPYLWKNTDDPLRKALEQLVFEASHPAYDSAAYFLRSFPYDSLSIPWDKFYIWEPMRFSVATTGVDASPIVVPGDTLRSDTTILRNIVRDSVMVKVMKDTTIMVIMDTLPAVYSSKEGFPFRYVRYPYHSDSLKAAVDLLMGLLEERDSSIVNITDIANKKTTVWLNSKLGVMTRHWLKNDLNDSVTVWIGNPERNTLGLYLEHGVNFRRPGIQGNVSDARVNVEKLDKSKLLDIQKIVTKIQYWRYRTESAFSLNQGMLSNWVKGGESSISTTLDLTAYFDYSNKPMLISSNHFARLKFGMLASWEDGNMKVMKNLDLLETNSKFNHKAFGKFDFSAIMLFKTQIAKGHNFTTYKLNGVDRDTAILVSRLMNPATLTIGLGLDYKPNKVTSINFSPLSYKATFVPDTSSIDQTKYGIAKDRRSKHEPGASFVFSNEFKPVKNVSVTNRLQLFTNYINNPLNIDVDWEMILVSHINWFTDVRLNTHLIFDDDTKTAVFDREDKPVMGSDGLQKKTARIQFKELLGFSFVFRF